MSDAARAKARLIVTLLDERDDPGIVQGVIAEALDAFAAEQTARADLLQRALDDKYLSPPNFYLSALQTEWHEMKARAERAEAQVARLRAALAHYATREAWQDHVMDSYSGQCWFFDWDGDLADDPWEIAQKALAEAER